MFTKSSFAIQPASPKWHDNFSRAHHLLGQFDHSKPVTISVATIITMITITITTTTMKKNNNKNNNNSKCTTTTNNDDDDDNNNDKCTTTNDDDDNDDNNNKFTYHAQK